MNVSGNRGMKKNRY